MPEQDSDQVRVVDHRERDRFEVTVRDQVAGFAAYRRFPARVAFTQTEIADAYQGRGLGSVLARGALDAVRAEGLEVTPLCPYIASFIRRHPDYLDLVDEAHREDLAPPD